MIYAQFFQRAVWPVGTLEIIEACCDKSVVIIDGRLSRETIGQIAADECKKRGYLAWQIFKGDTFTRSAPISQRWFIHSGKTDNSAMSATHGA